MRSSLLALTLLVAGVAWAGKPDNAGGGGGNTTFVAGYTLTEASIASAADAKGAWRDEAKAVFVNIDAVGSEIRGGMTDTKTGAKLSLVGAVADGKITGKWGPTSVCDAGGAATGTFVATLHKTAAGAPVLSVALDGATQRTDLYEQTATKLPGNLSASLTGSKTCQ